MVEFIKRLKEPENTAFKQQNIRSCRLVFRPISTIIFFLMFGACLVAIGVILYIEAQSIREYKLRYDDICAKYEECYVRLPEVNLRAPFYVYYQIDNFYQNNKRYYNSRNAKQLRGEMVYSFSELRDCSPYISKNNSLNLDDFYIPCGLMARSFFNDSFKIYNLRKYIELDKKDIAYSSQIGAIYKNPPSDQPGIRVINDLENEDFVVWMHPSAFPYTRKLWGVSYEGVRSAHCYCDVQNNFDVSAFNGKKYIVLVEKNWLGSSSRFLSILYIGAGSFYLLMSFIFLFVYIWSKRRSKIPAAREADKKRRSDNRCIVS
ncbi:uncharacterized protein LOC126317099 [Schistocerca gregaria]|uniref:uncharacterized protein LOC126317099 n=1 Tax=Schistocerca gregaria TaxID=7010 RepID=UPI00211EDFEE|nr:uncharacterized protein LOC126317099 [Schistocerca gregaria]